MEEYIAFDSHKHYTWVEHEQVSTGRVRQYRLEHAPGAIRKALAGGVGGAADALEEPPDGDAGQVRGAGQRVQRSLREGRARGVGGADRAVARADPLGGAADAGSTGYLERTDPAVRGAAEGTGRGHAPDAVADDLAGSGRDPGRHRGAGDRRDRALSQRRALGLLRGNHPAGPRQRRSRALRTHATRREPLSEVGVCRSRQLGGSESHAVPGAPRQPTLPAVAPAQGTREGDRSGGTTFGGSRVPRAQPPGGVSRSDGKTGSDQGGVSAILS